ncbi:MAG: methyltransferase domain-containing protein [Candidatus Lokiarchaeota archaeon]|nr:methyltransferase domain-containing protein [Candidatus Lokiarchaeota archaeon]
MNDELKNELDLDNFRKFFIEFTIKAFELLPGIDNPDILDIGCGSGVPTIKLAELSRGNIIAIDIDQKLLDKLRRKIEKYNLTDRIKVKKGSMNELDFLNKRFDIIWAEGSIAVIGFKEGIKKWKHFLKNKGFLVIHDDAGNVRKKIELIKDYDYRLIAHFVISKETWMKEYYYPVEEHLKKLNKKYNNKRQIETALNRIQREINMVNDSVFLVMQKR